MESRDLKIILLATIISLIVNPFIMLIYTFLEFFSTVKIGVPLTQYFLYGYSPLIIAGGYIAITKSNQKILISIMVGIFYGLSSILLNYFFAGSDYFFSRHFETTTAFILIRYINLFLLYVILISGSCVITSYIKERYSNV